MPVEHPQVPFINYRGRKVEVDQGIVVLLGALKEHGVNTSFSCEGSDKRAAYVLATRKTFRPLLNKIFRQYRLGLLSKESSAFVAQLVSGYHFTEFAHFFKHGEYQILNLKKSRGINNKFGYAIESLFSLEYGARVCVRWPYNKTHIFLKLLDELQ